MCGVTVKFTQADSCFKRDIRISRGTAVCEAGKPNFTGSSNEVRIIDFHGNSSGWRVNDLRVWEVRLCRFSKLPADFECKRAFHTTTGQIMTAEANSKWLSAQTEIWTIVYTKILWLSTFLWPQPISDFYNLYNTQGNGTKPGNDDVSCKNYSIFTRLYSTFPSALCRSLLRTAHPVWKSVWRHPYSYGSQMEMHLLAAHITYAHKYCSHTCTRLTQNRLFLLFFLHMQCNGSKTRQKK